MYFFSFLLSFCRLFFSLYFLLYRHFLIQSYLFIYFIFGLIIPFFVPIISLFCYFSFLLFFFLACFLYFLVILFSFLFFCNSLSLSYLCWFLMRGCSCLPESQIIHHSYRKASVNDRFYYTSC